MLFTCKFKSISIVSEFNALEYMKIKYINDLIETLHHECLVENFQLRVTLLFTQFAS